MRAIDILENCRERDPAIRNLQDCIWRMEKQMTSCAGGAGGASGHGTPSDRFAAYMAKKDEMEREMKMLRRKWAAEQVAVILFTEKLSDCRRDAMRLYYCRGRNADQIAMQINYSPRHVERMLKECREEMAQIGEDRVDAALPAWYIAQAKKEGGRCG